MCAKLIGLDDALIRAGSFAGNGPLDDLYTSNYLLSVKGHVVIYNTTYLEKYKQTIDKLLSYQPPATRVAVATPEELRRRFGVAVDPVFGQQVLVGPENELFTRTAAGELSTRAFAEVQYNPPAAPDQPPVPIEQAPPSLPAAGQVPPPALYSPPIMEYVSVGQPAYASYAAVRDQYGGNAVPLLAHARSSLSVPVYDHREPNIIRERGLPTLDSRWNLSMSSEYESVDLGEFAIQPRAVQEQVAEPVGWSTGTAVLGGIAALVALFPIVRRAWSEWGSRPVVAASQSSEVPPPYEKRNGHFRIVESLRKLKEHQEGDTSVPVDGDIDELIAENLKAAVAPLTDAEQEELVEFHKATKSRVVAMSGASVAASHGASGSGGGAVALVGVAAAALLLLNK